MMKFFSNLLIYLVSFSLLNSLINCEISDLRLCADPECKTILSLAKTKVSYPSGSDGMLSFKINSDVRVYSKSAGSNQLMWGVEIQGQRGYVNKELLKETKILVKSADLTYEVPTNLEELRRKQLEKDQAKLKSSQPEEVVAEATTTSPLPDQMTENVITNKVDFNSSTERTTGTPVPSKVVVDGTTVLVPVPPIQYNSAAVENENEEEDDEGIIVDEEDEEDNSNYEEAHEKELESEEIFPPKQTAEQTNVASGASELYNSPATHDNLTLSTSAELSQTNPEKEESNSISNDVRPVTEDVDENVPLNNIQLTEQTYNITPDIVSSVEDSAKAAMETTLNVNDAFSEHQNNMASPVSVLSVEEVINTVVESDIPNISEFADQQNNKTESLEDIVPAEKASTVAEQVGSSISKMPDKSPKGALTEASLMPKSQEKVTEVVFEDMDPSKQGSEIPQNHHETISQSPDQFNKISEDHDHDHHHSHGHYHDHAPEVNGGQMAQILPPITEFPPLHIKLTTPNYEHEQFIPNPLHDATATASANHEFSTVGSLEPDEITEPSLPLTEGSDSAEDDSRSMPSEPLKTEDPSSSIELTYEAAPDSIVPKDPELVPNALGSATPVETVRPTDELQAKQPLAHEHIASERKGLFDTILDTVNSFWSNLKTTEEKVDDNFDEALEKLLFPNKEHLSEGIQDQPKQVDDRYCENLSPNACPSLPKYSRQSNGIGHVITDGDNHESKNAANDVSGKQCIFENDYLTQIANKLLEMTDFIVFLGITALTILVFTFGHYCISNGRKENTLISKLNIVERSLLASHKEAAIAKYDLIETRNKLASIENNSFGSNDMVIALKRELNDSEVEKNQLQDQVAGLEKELENAAEAGLELNKIVSELLNNQPGDDSIISSVEELQKQLNEQQNTIFEINTTLAEKSRENSELQMLLGELNGKFQEDIDGLKSHNETLLNERNKLQSQLDEAKNIFEGELSKMMSQKNAEIEKLVKDLSAQVSKFEQMYRKYQASEARVEALEESLDSVKKNPNINMKDLLKATENKTEALSLKKERDSLKDRLEGEMDARKLLEDHVKIVSEEVSALKQEYNQSEKEKLEAQTRLEVLSSYFKDKEMQLQKELSVKEAMWMKQQGETTSTVERVRSMQDEVQALKSQNDSLRAEIEAQSAAHKAQITSLENRAHETWLAARQSERKLEESRSEATTLRRKLTSIAENALLNDIVLQNRVPNPVDGLQNHDINQASSPIHMESPGSPLLGGLPPPPLFLPRPFMGPPAPYMSMPPFMPPGEMRPPPLGRLMSPPPPPPPNRYSPSLVDDRDRYSPENGRYSPDSRYNYNTEIISTYDTETDFSPPPSPHGRSRGGGGGGYNSRERERDRSSYKTFSPPPNSDRNKKAKGVLSSGSADSFDSRKAKGKGKGKVNV